MTDQTVPLTFEPPGPGSWHRDPVHFPRPVTRYFAETHPDAFIRGTSEFMAFYGAPLGGMQSGYVNGFAYTTMRPAPDEEIPERFARAEEVWPRRVWREQLQEWDEVAKPRSIARHRALQAVDIPALSDDDLAAYLTECRDHHAEMMYQHMRFTASAMVPVGDLLAHLAAWTTVTSSDALAMMRGSAPVSAGASEQLGRLIAAIEADDDARAVLESDGDPEKVLSELRNADGEVGAAMTGYLELVGCRLLDGFDIAGRYALELPDTLVRAIRSFVAGTDDDGSEVSERIARIRAEVPEEHREEFDALLAEARLMYRLRDERGVFSDIWASGIMRRAALGAGRRVADRGGLHDPEHMVDASLDEMCALVRGASDPTADELAQRAAARTALGPKDAPPTLGPPPPPPPDASGLPPGVARVMAAVGIAMGELFDSSDAEHEENLLRGMAASGGVYEGIARRVAGPTEFGRIVDGDVLVTESTTEAFNILLPLLGAIVTDAGGLLSHSAIVAREYGIPGVVGTREATDLIPDGARVRVDGDAGEVHVFSQTMPEVVPLADAHEDARFGAKATGLGAAARAGLPIPPGIALSGAIVDEVAAGREDAIAEVLVAARHLTTPLAVRSSAADEDGADASFAGQHLTLLNVPSIDDVPAAVRQIWWSANSDSAITYRKRVGLFARPSVGVVVQSLLAADSAGVMFTQNPVNAADERLVEAAWGLGEVVVAGRVIPDTFRLARSGEVVECVPGFKKIAIRAAADGGTYEETIAPERREQVCLDDDQVAQLGALATLAEEVWGPARDIEWAFSGGRLYLLQCRAVTRTGSSPKPPPPPVDSETVEAIEGIPLFDGLSARDVEGMAALFKERRFAAGETVTKEGAGGAAFFVIESGEARVTLGDREIGHLGAGDYFGEVALIDEGARTATVTATTDLVCQGLTYWEFRPLVQQNATIAWNLLRTLARRLRDAQDDPHDA